MGYPFAELREKFPEGRYTWEGIPCSISYDPRLMVVEIGEAVFAGGSPQDIESQIESYLRIASLVKSLASFGPPLPEEFLKEMRSYEQWTQIFPEDLEESHHDRGDSNVLVEVKVDDNNVPMDFTAGSSLEEALTDIENSRGRLDALEKFIIDKARDYIQREKL